MPLDPFEIVVLFVEPQLQLDRCWIEISRPGELNSDSANGESQDLAARSPSSELFSHKLQTSFCSFTSVPQT